MFKISHTNRNCLISIFPSIMYFQKFQMLKNNKNKFGSLTTL